MIKKRLLLFCSESDRALGQKVADKLGLSLSPWECRVFEDGELKVRPLCDVRNDAIYLLASPHSVEDGSVHDQLCRLLFLMGSMKDAGASRITLLAPYLCYCRKDRKTKPCDPTTSQYVARLLETMGLDEIVTMDVHNVAAFQNAFRIPSIHLEGAPVLVQALIPEVGAHPVSVCSPDIGGVKRAEELRQCLSKATGKEVGFTVVYKERSQDVVTTGATFGQVDGHDVIIVDDMIVSGTTMRKAAVSCLSRGARRVMLVATHGLFNQNAQSTLLDASFDRIFVTNSLPLHLSDELTQKVSVVDISSLLVQTVTGGYSGKSNGVFHAADVCSDV